MNLIMQHIKRIIWEEYRKSIQDLNESHVGSDWGNYVVLYSKQKEKKPSAAVYDNEKDAKKFEKDMQKQGYITMIATSKKAKGVNEAKTEDDFENGVPVTYGKYSGEICMNPDKTRVEINGVWKNIAAKTVKGISVYGHDKLFIVPDDWNDVKYFNESINEELQPEKGKKFTDYPATLVDDSGKIQNLAYGYVALVFGRGTSAEISNAYYILNAEDDTWFRRTEGNGKGYGLNLRKLKVGKVPIRINKWPSYDKYRVQITYWANDYMDEPTWADEDDNPENWKTDNGTMLIAKGIDKDEVLSYIRKHIKNWKP